MSIIDNYKITRTTEKEGRAHWQSAGAEDVSWVFSNGKLVLALFGEQQTRIADFDLDDGETAAIDIQDFDDDGEMVPDSITCIPNTVPVISWNGVPDAVEYRIYHKEGSGGSEALVATIESNEEDILDIESPVELNGNGGVWHFFRVESVDQYNNESTRAYWSFWVYDVPDGIDGLTIENGSGPGLFDITIEA